MQVGTLNDLGSSLRQLRMERGLTLGVAARLAKVGRVSLLDWETGRYVPKGPALQRVLAALGASESLTARLLTLADPRFAQIALAHSPLGSSVHLGQVIRALRIRRSMGQSEAARTIGVTQSAIAKWESGESTPSNDTLHAYMFALGASAEETVAATQIISPQLRTPRDLEVISQEMEALNYAPLALRELLMLDLSSELWWRATLQDGAKPYLSHALANRAITKLFHGELSEVETLANQSIRVAESCGNPGAALRSIFALGWIKSRIQDDALGSARLFRTFQVHLRKAIDIDWFTTAEAMCLARGGDYENASKILESLEARILHRFGENATSYVRTDLVDVHLLGKRPRRAKEVLEKMGRAAPIRSKVRVQIALGEEPSPELMASFRQNVDPMNRLSRMDQDEVDRGIRHIRRRRAKGLLSDVSISAR